MFKKILTLVASAVMSLTAGQAWAQAVQEISNDGWSLSAEGPEFRVNSWSHEGDTDDSGMTTPFLQEWTNQGNLPQGTWTKTVTGLVPRGAYVFTALVRAYKEDGSSTPHGVTVSAGSTVSEDISTGTATLSNPAKGYYKTYYLNCNADENGNLQLRVNIDADNGCNWVAMKDMALFRTSVASFVRVTDGNIVSGLQYFVVYHENSDSDSGIALDGNYRNISKAENAVYDNKLYFTPLYGHWQGTKAILDEVNSCELIKYSGDSCSIIGNPHNKSNLYPGAGFVIYYTWVTSVIPNEDGSTFRIKRPTENYYIVYDGTNFIGSNSTTGSDLYLYKQSATFSFSQSTCTAAVNASFTAPTISKEGPGDWTLKYSSSNTDVAVVDENTGAVTPVAAGRAFITASYGHDNRIATSYQIIVKENGNVSLWADQNELEVGQTTTLHYNKNGLGAITYTSSDPTVLTVDADGVVTTHSAGTATVTATMAASQYYYGAQSNAVEITVNNKSIVKKKFRRISEIADIESGKNYLIVRQKIIDGIEGVALDGNKTGGAAQSVKIGDGVIEQNVDNSFVITKLADGKFSILGNGNGKYLNPNDDEVTYQSGSASLQIENDQDGFAIRRVAAANDSKYIIYDGGTFSGVKNAASSARKLYIYKESDLSKRMAHLTFWSNGNWVLTGSTLETGYWTDNEAGTIKYYSSDESIATIDVNGLIKGVSPGEVSFLAVVSESNEYYSTSWSITITVMDDYSDPLLTFVPQDGVTTIPILSTLRTETSHRGSGVVVYTSSDPNVAEIDANGVIKTYNVGQAVITAKLSADGRYSEASKSFMLEVTKRNPIVSPSFSTKTVALGETTNLLLTTESSGEQHFSSEDAGIATIDANGVIKTVGQGTVKLHYWVDECDNYFATSPDAYVTLIVSGVKKKTPIIQITPEELIMPVGGSMDVLVEMSEYGGQYSAAMEAGTTIARIFPINKGGNEARYNVEGLAPGNTFVTFTFPETDDYYGLERTIPVTVLDIYQYSIVVNGIVPSKGVEVEIFGVKHTKDETFTTYHPQINATDVHVSPVMGYTSSVRVEGRIITITYALKNVTRGTFIRLRNYSSNLYATLSADSLALGMAEAGLSNILYLDNSGRLLFYQNGQYVKSTNVMAAVSDASSANTFTFTRGSLEGKYKECFTIKSDANEYLMGSELGTSVGTGGENDYGYWYVEELTELPVSVSANGYGYATLYCPVAVNIPGGVSAYYVSRKDADSSIGNSSVEYRLYLTAFVSSIPANTPAVIVGMPGTTYQFGLTATCSETVTSLATGMTGHVAASWTSSISGHVYALQPNSQKEKVGFYPWKKTVTYGFKAYFVSVNGEASVYRLVFEGEETDLQQLEAIEDNETIYDLCGRPVGDSFQNLSRGIYIRGGRKIIIK